METIGLGGPGVLELAGSLVAPLIDERARWLLAGAEALALGRGGVSAVARATELGRATVRRAWPTSGLGRPWSGAGPAGQALATPIRPW